MLTATDVATSVESIIMNGVEDCGVSSVDELTAEQSAQILDRVLRYTATVRP